MDADAYEQGYRDGQRSGSADWWLVLEELYPDGTDVTPLFIYNDIIRLRDAQPS